jgi:hypothetical protein
MTPQPIALTLPLWMPDNDLLPMMLQLLWCFCPLCWCTRSDDVGDAVGRMIRMRFRFVEYDACGLVGSAAATSQYWLRIPAVRICLYWFAWPRQHLSQESSVSSGSLRICPKHLQTSCLSLSQVVIAQYDHPDQCHLLGQIHSFLARADWLAQSQYSAVFTQWGILKVPFSVLLPLDFNVVVVRQLILWAFLPTRKECQ